MSAHSWPDDLCQQMFDIKTISIWHSTLCADDWHVPQEALQVLGLAINYSMLHVLLYIVFVLTVGQMICVSRFLTLRQYPCGVICSIMVSGMSEMRP